MDGFRLHSELYWLSEAAYIFVRMEQKQSTRADYCVYKSIRYKPTIWIDAQLCQQHAAQGTVTNTPTPVTAESVSVMFIAGRVV